MRLPTGAHERLNDPSALVSAAEIADTTIDRKSKVRRWKRRAQTARHLIAALPGEPLDDDDRLELARRLAGMWTDRGCAVILAVHEPTGAADNNHHCHLVITTRTIDGARLGKKIRSLVPECRRKRGARRTRVKEDGLRHRWRAIQDCYFVERGWPEFRVAPDGSARERDLARALAEEGGAEAVPARAPELGPDDDAIDRALGGYRAFMLPERPTLEQLERAR